MTNNKEKLDLSSRIPGAKATKKIRLGNYFFVVFAFVFVFTLIPLAAFGVITPPEFTGGGSESLLGGSSPSDQAEATSNTTTEDDGDTEVSGVGIFDVAASSEEGSSEASAGEESAVTPDANSSETEDSADILPNTQATKLSSLAEIEPQADNTGTCGAEGDGSNLTWIFDEATGLLTISGNGAMANYTSNAEQPWTSYAGSIKTVDIESGVTSIGNNAFFYLVELTSVSISDTVASIGESAFYGCDGMWCGSSGSPTLTSIVIPGSVKTIGASAFGECYGLSSITLQEGVESIGEGAFYPCSNSGYTGVPPYLTSLTIPASVRSISSYAFGECYDLQELIFLGATPPSNIAADAFYSVANEGFVQCPKNATGYTAQWLAGLNGLTNWVFNLPENISGTCGAEGDGSNLTWTLETNGTLTISGSGAMENFDPVAPWNTYAANVKSVLINEGVTNIGTNALADCKNLTAFTIPQSVAALGDSAFLGCAALASISVPGSVESIGASAFVGCTNLSTLTLEEGVGSIGTSAFEGLRLSEVAIPGSVKTIGERAFANCIDLETLVLAEGTVSIGDSAFQECSALGLWNPAGFELAIPGSVEHIGASAFVGTYLRSIVLNEGLETIGESAFSGLLLRSVTVPSTVERVGRSAFKDCHNLATLTLVDGVGNIEESAFQNCTALTSVAIPASIGNIEKSVFQGNSSLTSATIAEGVTAIGESAFQNARLGGIVIPGSVKTIGASAFNACDFMETLTLGEGIQSIGDYAFFYCGSGMSGPVLTSVSIPGSVESIGDYAFSGSSLTNLTLNEGLKRIGVGAFGESATHFGEQIGTACNLSSLIIPSTVTTIQENAFSNNYQLNSISFSTLEPPAIATNSFSYVAATGTVHHPRASFAYNRTWLASLEGISAWTFTPHGDISGYCGGEGDGTNLSWYLSETTGVLTISGTGTMANWEADKLFQESYGYYQVSNTAPWGSHNSAITSVVVEEGVTSVGTDAFAGLSNITTATLSKTVKSLGERAFLWCSKLVSASLFEGITAIQPYTFANCAALTTVNIPGGVTRIGEYAFYECRQIKDFVLPDGLTSIERAAFQYALYGGDLFVVPDSVTSIGESAFVGLRFKSVLLPKGLTRIENGVFTGASLSNGITIPDSVTSIGKTAFSSTYLPSIVIPENVTSVEEQAFWCLWSCRSITIKGNIESMGPMAFAYCDQVEELILEEGITTISYMAFWRCGEHTSSSPSINLVIPDSVTEIEGGAFAQAKEIASVTLGKGVTYIDSQVFAGTSLSTFTIPAGVQSIASDSIGEDSSLTSLVFEALTPPTVDPNAFYYIPATGTVYVPAGSTGYDQAWLDSIPALSGWTLAILPGINVSAGELQHGEVVLDTSDAQQLSVSGSDLLGDISWQLVDETNTFAVEELAWTPASGGDLKITFTPSDDLPKSAYLVLSTPVATPVKVYLSGQGTYLFATLTNEETKVSVSGYYTADATALHVTEGTEALHPQDTCEACDAIRVAGQSDKMVALYNISLVAGRYKEMLTVSIPVGDEYEGQELTLLHCSGEGLESMTSQVVDGRISGSFSTLSPFAVIKPAEEVTPPNISAGAPGVIGLPTTGDSPVLLLLLGGLALAALALVLASSRIRMRK